MCTTYIYIYIYVQIKLYIKIHINLCVCVCVFVCTEPRRTLPVDDNFRPTAHASTIPISLPLSSILSDDKSYSLTSSSVPLFSTMFRLSTPFSTISFSIWHLTLNRVSHNFFQTIFFILYYFSSTPSIILSFIYKSVFKKNFLAFIITDYYSLPIERLQTDKNCKAHPRLFLTCQCQVLCFCIMS